MKPIRIVRHEEPITPGYLAETLEARGLPFEEIALDRGEALPQAIDDISALVFLGCTHSLTEDAPWMREEIRLIQSAANAGLPILGHCFGSQLIANALGGEVYPLAEKEIGWHTVRRADTAVAQDWCGEEEKTEILIWHHDGFTLPDAAAPLYSSRFCADQAFVVGDNILATVAHVEVTPELLENWVSLMPEDLAPVSERVQSPEQMRADLPGRVQRMQRLTDKLYHRWLSSFAPRS